MNCEKCGGAMWDNTVDKKNPKGPDYKCKDKACAHAVWLDKKGTKAPAKNGTAPVGKWTWKTLQETYRKSLLIAQRQVSALVPNATPADVVAGAATVFITASRDGIQPEPLPPQPLTERPKQLDEPDDDSSLPF